MNEDFLWWVGENSWPGRVCRSVSQSVIVCVQTFLGIAPERLVRSGPAWHHSTHQNAGMTMVPVISQLVAHGTRRRVNACNNFRTAPQGKQY